MKEIMLKCKNCGASIEANLNSQVITCTHCGSSYLLSEILGGENPTNFQFEDSEELSRKMEFSKAIKQAETFMFQADYEHAERYFKLAISFDEKNYKGYLGVVKSKTHNYNFLPQNDDYKHYMSEALKLAGEDDYYSVKRELEKLEVLKQEYARAKLQKSKPSFDPPKTASREKATKFLTKLAYFITGIVAVAVLVGFIISLALKEKEENSHASQIEISTAEEFLNFASSDKYLSATIILKSDIDLNGATIKPIASGEDIWFTGTFTGNGYALKNFSIVLENLNEFSYLGLFSKTSNATISGVMMKNVSISLSNTNSSTTISSVCIGFVVGFSKNSTISNCGIDDLCKIDISSSNSGLFAGSIIGRAEQTQIKLCYAANDVNISLSSSSNDNYAGGLTGFMENSNIENCYYSGNLNFSVSTTAAQQISFYVAGISGLLDFRESHCKVVQSYFSGNIIKETNSSNALIISDLLINVLNSNNETDETHANYIYENCVLSASETENNFATIVSTENALTAWIESKFSEQFWVNISSSAPTLKISKS